MEYLQDSGLGMLLTQTVRQTWLLTTYLRCSTSTSLIIGKNPIRTMVDGITNKQMLRWHRNRESGKAALWEITPHYAEKLEVEKERAKFCKPIQAGVNLWQVTSG